MASPSPDSAINFPGNNFYHLKSTTMSNSQKILFGLLSACSVFMFPGCAVVGGIFKAGVWVGVLGVVFVVGIIIFIVSRAKKD